MKKIYGILVLALISTASYVYAREAADRANCSQVGNRIVCKTAGFSHDSKSGACNAAEEETLRACNYDMGAANCQVTYSRGYKQDHLGDDHSYYLCNAVASGSI